MMAYLPYIIIASVVILFLGALTFLTLRKQKKEPKRKKRIRAKDRNAIIKQANKRLMQNPKDVDALLALADLYYREGVYEKAFNTYNTLVNLCATNPDLDEFEVTLRYAIAAFKLKNYEEAYKSLVIARTINEDNFELCFHLGYLEYLRKDYEKAIPLFLRARGLEPEHVQTIRYLGQSLFKIRKYKEASEELMKAIEFEPNDKQSLFALAQCHYEIGHNDRALSIFTHLRPDPVLGPNAALFAGTIHLNNRNYQKAIMDFEIGLKHDDINTDVEIELKYRLASAYLKQTDISRALNLLEEIRAVKADYKDVAYKIKRYKQLSTNRNLQIFLMAPNSEFLTLCRKMASNFFGNAKTKLISISLHKNEYVDILAEVYSKKWEDHVLFRFIRTTGTIGELVLRDLHSHCKELKADRAFCISAGDFTDGAKQFVDARLIDLIDKSKIAKIFDKIYSKRMGSFIT